MKKADLGDRKCTSILSLLSFHIVHLVIYTKYQISSYSMPFWLINIIRGFELQFDLRVKTLSLSFYVY